MSNPSIRLSIPNPCSQTWGGMTPVSAISAHCKACDKVLVDFSKMSDTEVALWFKHNKGKVCGRFTAQQLDRKIMVPADKPVRKYWLNALWLIPFTWFAKPGQAQTISGKPPVCVNNGQTSSSTQKEAHEISVPTKGHVQDGDKRKSLDGATVTFMKDGAIVLQLTTDKKGHFVLPENFRSEGLTIDIRKDGYEAVMRKVEAGDKLEFVLYNESRFIMMGDVAYDPD